MSYIQSQTYKKNSEIYWETNLFQRFTAFYKEARKWLKTKQKHTDLLDTKNNELILCLSERDVNSLKLKEKVGMTLDSITLFNGKIKCSN